MGLIMEGWRGFLNEQTEDRGSPKYTKYTDRINRLVGVTEKAVLHLKKFLEHLEIIYDEANIKKGGGGYTYLGLGKKWPSELDRSEKYNIAVQRTEARIKRYNMAIKRLFDYLNRGTTKNLFPDETKKLKALVLNLDRSVFRDIVSSVSSRHYPQVSYAALARSGVSFNERKQMAEERIAAIEEFANDVLLDYIRSHNLFVDWAKTQGGGTVSREVAYNFPIDIAPQLGCKDKIAYFEEILKSYEDNPNIIGRIEDLIREEVDFEEMVDDPSPYEKCVNKMGIEKTAQQSTDDEMAAFDLDEE